MMFGMEFVNGRGEGVPKPNMHYKPVGVPMRVMRRKWECLSVCEDFEHRTPRFKVNKNREGQSQDERGTYSHKI
jgi:hypothetical protein